MTYSTEAQQELFELSHSLLARAKRDIVQLDKETASELVAQLHKTIRYHEWRYYVLNEPVLSDFEFDSLFGLLKKNRNYLFGFAHGGFADGTRIERFGRG
jgi:DNA ligase (NAD+)